MSEDKPHHKPQLEWELVRAENKVEAAMEKRDRAFDNYKKVTDDCFKAMEKRNELELRLDNIQ